MLEEWYTLIVVFHIFFIHFININNNIWKNVYVLEKTPYLNTSWRTEQSRDVYQVWRKRRVGRGEIYSSSHWICLLFFIRRHPPTWSVKTRFAHIKRNNTRTNGVPKHMVLASAKIRSRIKILVSIMLFSFCTLLFAMNLCALVADRSPRKYISHENVI